MSFLHTCTEKEGSLVWYQKCKLCLISKHTEYDTSEVLWLFCEVEVAVTWSGFIEYSLWLWSVFFILIILNSKIVKRVNGKESFLILILPLFNILFVGNFWCPVSCDLSRIVLCSHNYGTIQSFRKNTWMIFCFFTLLLWMHLWLALLICGPLVPLLIAVWLLTLSYCNRNRTNSIMNIFACTLLFASTPLGKIPGSAIARSKAVMFENYLY